MFTDPIKNLKAFGLREDNIVGDLGAGTGYYSIPIGLMVPKGKVYAVEVVQDFLTTIKNKALDANLTNVEILWGNIEKIGGTKIGDNILDAVIASNVLFQVEDKERFIEEIRRILKPEGRVLLIDWSTDSPVTSPLLGRKKAIPKDLAREMFERKGFKSGKDINTGPHHYGMILAKD
ncbi:MAG: class I SAM-dependent methyltransferase [Candidatus Paceibacterota bacterium]